MKKIYLSSFLVLSFAVFALNQQLLASIFRQSVSSEEKVPTIPEATTPLTEQKKIISQTKNPKEDDEEKDDDNKSSYQNTAPVISSPKIPSPQIPVATTPSTGKYKNGTYTGNAVAQYYGKVQVRAVITGGKLTDVVFVQYPNQGNSMEINSYALPILRTEAISAQSAKVNAVSGASETSPAFIASLDSALKQAVI